MQIDGVSALVTGGASGLGAATAAALRERGANVVVADLPGSRERVDERLRHDERFADATEIITAVAAAVETAQELGLNRSSAA